MLAAVRVAYTYTRVFTLLSICHTQMRLVIWSVPIKILIFDLANFGNALQ